MRNRSRPSNFSLFAFQDIITSVMGIMVLITLILALELMERVEESPAQQTAEVLDELLDVNQDLSSQIAAMEEQLEKSTSAILDLPSLNVAKLTEELQRIEEDNNIKRNELSRLRRLRLEKQNKLAAMTRTENTKGKSEDAELQILLQQIKEYKKTLEKAEKDDRVYFRTGIVGKKTYLVEISRRGFYVAEIGKQQSPRLFSNANSFASWVDSLNANSDALYLVVKPGGTANFESAQKFVKNGRLEYGYSVVAETKTLIDPKLGAGTP